MSKPEPPPSRGVDEPQPPIEQLVRYAEDLRRVRSSKRALSQHIVTLTASRPRVLVADDDSNLRLLVSATIGPDVYEIIEATRGTEALMLAKAKQPALIILDVGMPDLDGVEVCQRVREDPLLHDIPIIMLTSARDDADRRAGLEAGANRYLTKPFSPAELLDVVDQLLLKR